MCVERKIRTHLDLLLCFLPIYSGREACGRTSRGHTGGRSHRISHPPSFCGACLNFSREKDSAVPFPRRPWSRILCTFLIVLHFFDIFFFYIYFCEEKSQLPGFTVCFLCVFSSHLFWTSMDVPAGVTQEEGNTGFSNHLLSAVLALIFLARRIQPFLSLVDREVEFCVLTI